MKSKLFKLVFFVLCAALLSGCDSCKKDGNDKKDGKPDTKQDGKPDSKQDGKKGPKIVSSKKSPVDTLKSGLKVNLNAVSFFDEARGIIAGDSGRIQLTKNAGINWTQVGTTTDNLYGISYVNANTVVAVGRNGTVLRSTNGGATWLYVGPGLTKTLRGVSFSGMFGEAVGDSGALLRTSNGGANWTIKSSGTLTNLSAVHAVNGTSNVFVTGNNGLLRKSTNNGGVWDSVSVPTNVNLKSIFFPEMLRGYAVGDSGIILKTTDGGSTWAKMKSPTTNSLRGVHMFTPQAGYAVGINGTVVYIKGDTTWLVPPPTSNNLNAADPPTLSLTEYWVGDNGEIFLANPPAYAFESEPTNWTATPEDPCKLTITLNTGSLTWNNPAVPVPTQYEHFQLNTSLSVPLNGWQTQAGSPGAGWAVSNDPHHNFFPKGENLTPSSSYTTTIEFESGGAAGGTSGYVTIFYLDQSNNPWLLERYQFDCP